MEPTLMFLLGNNLGNGGLQNPNISVDSCQPTTFTRPSTVGYLEYLPIQCASKSSRQQCNGKTGREAKDKHADQGPDKADHEDRFPANSVTKSAPKNPGGKLGECKGRGDETCVQPDLIFVVGDLK